MTVITSSDITSSDASPDPNEFPATFCAVVLGVAITLVIGGYQFGVGNHSLYLLDSLRVNDPALLANDWYTTHTLQYHIVFTHVSAALARWGILRPTYLAGYVALAVLLHVGWYRITRALGGSRRTYLLSVLLFYLSAAGLGLGVFSFLQDSSFLPSNVANVAMLWGILYWMTGRPWRAGLLLGLSGFLHINHSVAAILLWGALVGWRMISNLKWIKGSGPISVILVLPCLPNLIPAARVSLGAAHQIPLKDFIDLFVHFRHPHHYDPLSWPIVLWITFLWPFPPALFALRRAGMTPALREACRVTIIFCALMLISLLFAGVWFISEPLVQMCFFRFSIYPKLLTCIGAAVVLLDGFKRFDRYAPFARRMGLASPFGFTLYLAIVVLLFSWFGLGLHGFLIANRAVIAGLCGVIFVGARFDAAEAAGRSIAPLRAWLFSAATLGLIAILTTNSSLGLRSMLAAPPAADYLAVCDFAREHTPVDAVFLVPPGEQEFRIVAHRAIVVNFKGVPQLGAELGEWHDRMSAVLDLPRLSAITNRYDQAAAAIFARYESLPARHLIATARRYRARYVVVAHAADDRFGSKPVFVSGPYRMYDLDLRDSP
jgi:hypothetical protein